MASCSITESKQDNNVECVAKKKTSNIKKSDKSKKIVTYISDKRLVLKTQCNHPSDSIFKYISMLKERRRRS